MGKILKTSDPHYSYGVKDNYNIHIERVSRWIKINYIFITKRSPFWKYGDPYSEEAERGKREILVFKHKNKLYCLDQFIRLDTPTFYEENKEEKAGFLSGYDSIDYYNPLMIEIHPDGEYIRLYRELTETEYIKHGIID